MKLMVLLLVFNSQAAAVTSLVVSIAVGLAEASGVASDVSLFFPCYWLYLLVLCFWQRISGLCRRQTMVFLDKLCIHQKDDKMKEKGILGLGAFVRRSDNLLVLWSKNYFNRLQLISSEFNIGLFFLDIFLVAPLPHKTLSQLVDFFHSLFFY